MAQRIYIVFLYENYLFFEGAFKKFNNEKKMSLYGNVAKNLFNKIYIKIKIINQKHNKYMKLIFLLIEINMNIFIPFGSGRNKKLKIKKNIISK